MSWDHCHYCHAVIDKDRETCCNCGRPSWGCSFCGSKERSLHFYSYPDFSEDHFSSRLRAYACADCRKELSVSEAQYWFWRLFFSGGVQ